MGDQPKPRGRQSKLTPRRASVILKEIGMGVYASTACRMAGISPPTLYNWLNAGADEISRVEIEYGDAEGIIMEWLDAGYDSKDFKDDFKPDNMMWISEPPEEYSANEWLFALFSLRYKKAQGLAEHSIVEQIMKETKAGSWQAGAWLLERTRPQDYGRKERIELEGTNGPAIKVASSTVEGLMQRVQDLVAVKAAQDADDEQKAIEQ